MGSTLKEQYETCLAEKRRLETVTLGKTSDAYKELYSQTLDQFLTLRRAIDQHALFSSNEDLDDLSTSDIPYLGVDYQLAVILEQGYDGSKSGFLRSDFVNQAINYHLNFLKNLADYGILPNSLATKLKAALASGGGADLSKLQTSNPADRRAEKIEMFKLERTLEQMIRQHEAEPDTKDPDESLRQTYISQLGLFSLKSFGALATLELERELLSHRPPESELERLEKERKEKDPAYRAKAQEYNTKVEAYQAMAPLLSKTGKVNRPFTIVNSRDQIKRNIFGTGQELPTMTVEEYLDEEMKRGGIIQGGGEASRTDPDDAKQDEDDNDKADMETYKDREFDEFKDDNPRGSGNRANMG